MSTTDLSSPLPPQPAVPLSSSLPKSAIPTDWSLADLQQHLGGVPLERIRLYPPPGLATEEDALWLDDHQDRLFELVDGILVEKTVSSYESQLALILGYFLHQYLESHPLGIATGPDGQLWILPSRMRIPDVSFIRWDRFPGGKLPDDSVYKMAPDLAVEILSEGNPRKEMELKLDEYFQAGVRLVWYINPRTKTAELYTSRNQCTTISETGILEGGEVLPGFQLRLGELFERAQRRGGSAG
jgi:Uma2 family endonuclease